MSPVIVATYVWWLSVVTLCYNLGRYFDCFHQSGSFRDLIFGIKTFLEIERLLIITFCVLNLIYL